MTFRNFFRIVLTSEIFSADFLATETFSSFRRRKALEILMNKSVASHKTESTYILLSQFELYPQSIPFLRERRKSDNPWNIDFLRKFFCFSLKSLNLLIHTEMSRTKLHLINYFRRSFAYTIRRRDAGSNTEAN